MENSDLKMNSYLDDVNHAPYGAIMIGGLSVLFLLTFVVLLGIF